MILEIKNVSKKEKMKIYLILALTIASQSSFAKKISVRTLSCKAQVYNYELDRYDFIALTDRSIGTRRNKQTSIGLSANLPSLTDKNLLSFKAESLRNRRLYSLNLNLFNKDGKELKKATRNYKLSQLQRKNGSIQLDYKLPNMEDFLLLHYDGAERVERLIQSDKIIIKCKSDVYRKRTGSSTSIITWT